MVSVSSIGKVFNTPINFYAQPNSPNKPADKEKIKSFANSQMNMGYACLAAAAIAVTGSMLKKGALKYIAPIPAACASAMLGSNMISSGDRIKKALDTKS